ncbi:hypothetical protein DL770_008678 [Monosporascus sp. CRB-9-2]|nr:hypothetical protein DL770_008678 [Monosporascus sp. CRB-9-2]
MSNAVTGPYTTGLSNPDDAELYAMARRLLEDMAQLGDPTGKDHQVLLTDMERVVKVKMTIGMDDGIPLEHFWQDIDWEYMLSTYSRHAEPVVTQYCILPATGRKTS